MPNSAHDIDFGGLRSSAGLDSSPARYPPLYDINTFCGSIWCTLTPIVFLGYCPAGHVDRRVSCVCTQHCDSGLQKALEAQGWWRCLVTEDGLSGHGRTFVRSREKDDYHERLAVLLAELPRRLEVLSLVAAALLALPEDFI